MRHIISYSDFSITEGITRVPYTTDSGWNRSAEYKNLILGRNTNIEKILKFIFDGGETGKAWKEIHRFIVEDIKGLKQNLSNNNNLNATTLADLSNRGYYSSVFTNFLPYFCEKSNKNWVLTDSVLLAYFSGKKKEIKTLIGGKLADMSSSEMSADNREKLSKHPNISDEMLVKLAFYDPDERVRFIAQKNPKLKKIKGLKLLREIEDLRQIGVI
jgi:hypothetical protein